MVNIGLRVLARPQATMLPEMYRKLGLDFDERVLPSIMNEVLAWSPVYKYMYIVCMPALLQFKFQTSNVKILL